MRVKPPTLQSVKKDELWKPILREFRRFLKEITASKKMMLPKLTPDNIEEVSSVYFDCLKLPEEFKTQDNLAAILLLIENRAILKQKKISEPFQLKDNVFERLKATFFDIFNENSRRLRQAFFKDSLIKVLWGKYVKE